MYQFVVQFLRFFLAPIYELHEVKQAGDHEILVKWSWTMNFWWNRYNPFRVIWDPRLAFSGVTVLGYNPDSGAQFRFQCLVEVPFSRVHDNNLHRCACHQTVRLRGLHGGRVTEL